MAHGGKRAGSGRKKTELSRVQEERKLPKVTAEEILGDESFDEKNAWLSLLNATIVTSVAVIGTDGEKEQITVPDYRTRLESLKYLTDRRDGKAKQALEHTGAKGGPITFTVRHIAGNQPTA